MLPLPLLHGAAAFWLLLYPPLLLPGALHPLPAAALPELGKNEAEVPSHRLLLLLLPLLPASLGGSIPPPLPALTLTPSSPQLLLKTSSPCRQERDTRLLINRCQEVPF